LAVELQDPADRVRNELLARARGTAVDEIVSAIYPGRETKGVATKHSFVALRRALDTYFLWNRGLDYQSRQKWERRGQIAWSKTGHARLQRESLAAWLGGVEDRIRTRLSDVRFITDLGAGDGQMTCFLIKSLSILESSLSSVTLIDHNSAALRLATCRLRKQFSHELVIKSEHGHFQQMTLPSVDAQFRLIFASGALHELPHSFKKELLRQLARQACFLITIEFEADHERPLAGSSNLVWRAAEFYEALMADAFDSLPATSARKVIGVFLLDELLDLWLNEYNDRHNYHLPAAGWTELLTEAGFRLCSVRAFDGGGLRTSYILAQSSA
jgi:ubiquinone/menaquinone biosynthesis C-methylase UbiE